MIYLQVGTRRSLIAIVALGVAVAFGAALAPGARANKAASVSSPREGALITEGGVRVELRDVGARFEALAGSHDVSARFRRSRSGRRATAVLRRGRELQVGTNRLVVSSGRGARRRHAARTFVVGRHRAGLLRMRRQRGTRSALAVRVRQTRGASFESVRIALNGHRVRTRDWVVGRHVSSSRWPLGERSFVAMFGLDDGLRHGVNRLTLTAWRSDGTFDRASVRVRVPRSTPLISAGDGARARAGAVVRLHGRARAAGRRDLRYRWRIVRAPRGSHAKLRRARSLRPQLVSDRRGRYRVRLLATARTARRRGRGNGRAGPPAFAGSAPSRSAIVDEATVEATPRVPPIGLPIETITSSGGIEVGGKTYDGGSGDWAQLLVLDASTLEVVANRSFGDASGVTSAAVNELQEAISGLADGQIVVLSGGRRAADVSGVLGSSELSELFGSVGAGTQYAEATGNWPRLWARMLAEGRWSLIGGTGSSAVATTNLFGMIYGLRAGGGSEPGALTGYLQQTLHSSGTSKAVSYGFASANVTTIDTNVPGAPAGVNEIEVGSQVYSSERLDPGYSGFHVLILDSMLHKITERTFAIDAPGKEPIDTNATAEMQELIADRTAPRLGTPGYLVIVQSIGQPFGWQREWVWDRPLVTDSYGTDYNARVPRNDSTWYDPASAGQTLAGALGVLGGPVAHDQVAQLQERGGYTLIASSGQIAPTDKTEDLRAAFSSSAPVSRRQLPQASGSGAVRPPARVVGTLSRDRQSLWKVGTPASLPAGQGTEISELAYQPPTQWPLTGGAASKANAYIARQLDLTVDGAVVDDVRDAYPAASDEGNWSDKASDLADLPFPGSGHGFRKATFSAVKGQLHMEMIHVNQVWSLIDSYQELLGVGATGSYIDLQTIAQHVAQKVKRYDAEDRSSVNTGYIVADSLWIAGDAAAALGQDEISIALDVGSGLFELAADTSTDSSGAPSLAKVEAEASQLGTDVANRYTDIANNAGVIGAILVSDYGKLEAAHNLPSLGNDSTAELKNALRNTAQREFYAALLSTVYGVYAVDPNYVMEPLSSANNPWGIKCQVASHNAYSPSTTRPFSSAAQGAWAQRTVGVTPGPARRTIWFGLQTQADIVTETVQRDQHIHGEVRHDANPVPDSTSSKLFDPLTAGGDSLGIDKLAFLADPRFKRWWFNCDASNA